MIELIASLCNAFGPPGFETEIRQVILEQLGLGTTGWSDDALGNLYVTESGRSNVKLLVAAAMDEPGFFITSHGPDGQLHFAPIGRLPLQQIHGCLARMKNGIRGMFVRSGEQWLIDIGAKNREEAEQRVPVGTVGAFGMSAQILTEDGRRIIGKALTRSLIAALIEVMQDSNPPTHWVGAFLAQQEPSGRGARVVGEHWQPARIVSLECIDCTSEEGASLQLGGGPVLVMRAAHFCSDPRWSAKVVTLAEKDGIPIQRFAGDLELPMSERLQLSGHGAAVASLAIPVRYLDRSWQMIDLEDVRLLARWLKSICSVNPEEFYR